MITMAWFLTAVLGTASAASSSPGYIDLRASSYSGPGLGFAFADADATASGMAFVSSALPACAQGPLDALYFYVYGCEVPAGTVTALAAEVGAGFLYASDKSLTFTVPSSNASLLLANAYALELSYEGDLEESGTKVVSKRYISGKRVVSNR